MLSKLKKVSFKITIYKILICVFCLFLGFASFVSLYTHNEFDPSIFTVNDEDPLNVLGVFGANLSSLLLVILGDASWLLPISMIFLLRIVLLKEYSFYSFILRFFGAIFCIFSGIFFCRWNLPGYRSQFL